MYNDLHVPAAVAVLAPIINCVQLFPQLYKTFITKSVKDLSLYSLLILFASLLWLLHGYFIMDYPLIIAGTINTSVNVCLIALYFIYRKSS
jgi:uncharacterized protein with PQ loop repeat